MLKMGRCHQKRREVLWVPRLVVLAPLEGSEASRVAYICVCQTRI